MPPDEELVIGREDALVENLERGLEQRRALTEQDHLALLGKTDELPTAVLKRHLDQLRCERGQASIKDTTGDDPGCHFQKLRRGNQPERPPPVKLTFNDLLLSTAQLRL